LKRLAILGASGHGKVVADAASLSGWGLISFFDDAWPQITEISVWKIEGSTSDLLNRLDEFDGVIIAIGNNSIRFQKFEELEKNTANLVSIIHPSAIVSSLSTISSGCFVGAGAIINPDSSIGKACIINTNAVVEHDCEISDAVHISPSSALAGGVKVGDQSWIGLGSFVKQLVNIGSHVVVGMGSVVIRNVPENCTIVGSPARILER
jgi:sugar O-acyltransferase (sialic acid O-acetyltransferase NeuD family)